MLSWGTKTPTTRVYGDISIYGSCRYTNQFITGAPPCTVSQNPVHSNNQTWQWSKKTAVLDICLSKTSTYKIT